jgi:hypothetical protein
MHALPASISSFVTVFLLAPVSRVTERMLPSQSKWRMRARSAEESLFMRHMQLTTDLISISF